MSEHEHDGGALSPIVEELVRKMVREARELDLHEWELRERGFLPKSDRDCRKGGEE